MSTSSKAGHVYEIRRVLNVSTGRSEHACYVSADSFEDAQAAGAQALGTGVTFTTQRVMFEQGGDGDDLRSSYRIDRAIGAGLDAFWAAVARQYPEISTGDVPFDDPIEDAARASIEAWVADNAPQEFKVTLTATVRAASISDVDDDRLGDALMAFPEVVAVEGGVVR